MSKFKRLRDEPSPASATAPSADLYPPISPFAHTRQDLESLFEPSPDAARLRSMGGVDGVVRGLRVDPQRGVVTTAGVRLTPMDDVKAEKGSYRMDDGETGEGLGVDVRARWFGRNVLPPVPTKSLLQFMVQAMGDKILILLSCAALVSLAIGIYEDTMPDQLQHVHWIEGFSIIVAVIIVVVASSVNDWSKERQFRKLNDRKEDRRVKCLRGGEVKLVSVYDVVVGDLLLLEPGDVLPADGLYMTGMGLKCDESSLTGESDSVKKGSGEKADPFLLSGSKVVEGVGRCVVVGVGEGSCYGKLLMGMRGETGDTPLQVKLDGLAERIAKLGSAVAILMWVISHRVLVTILINARQPRFFVLLIKYIVIVVQTNGFGNAFPEQESGAEVVAQLVKIIISSITIVVVAVPEGLPLAVTLALAYATTRMLQDNNLVRVLSACETMGNATTICSDKTGTLTQNKMTVVAGVVGKNVSFDNLDERLNLDARIRTLPRGDDALLHTDPIAAKPDDAGRQRGHEGGSLLDVVMEGCALNSSAFEGEPDEAGRRSFVGSKTEVALLDWLRASGRDLRHIRESSHVVQIYPFSSERKRMGCVVRKDGGPRGAVYRVHVKGAGEMVLRDCDRAAVLPWSGRGQAPKPGSKNNPEAPGVVPMDKKTADELTSVVNRFAEGCMRTLCIAYRDFDEEEWEKVIGTLLADVKAAKKGEGKPAKDVFVMAEERPRLVRSPGGSDVGSEDGEEDVGEMSLEEVLAHPLAAGELIGRGLICAALVGLEDPLREEVSNAVAECQRAGVMVRMVTGDNILTARAIATRCGIHTRGGVVMEGGVFRNMGGPERLAMLPRLQVLARSTPADKQLLVSLLKQGGETVAVTGDGTNDGPALKMADVGFSMGIAGTEVAKEASSIILMDDSFGSVVKAIMWGRSVNDSVKKFLQFQLSVNISAVFITFISSAIDSAESSVLTAVQLLWVNLIMDTLAALALATERPTRELLNRPPDAKNASLISVTMWKMIIGQAVLQISVNLALLFAGAELFNFNELAAAGGILKELDGLSDPIILEQKAVLRTIVFNAFVLMQLFNEINCRRIDNHVNVFKNIFSNPFFCIILGGCLAVHVVLVEFGGTAFQTRPLTALQWGVCLLVGSLSLPWGVVLRLIPDDVFSCFGRAAQHRQYEHPSLRSSTDGGAIPMTVAPASPAPHASAPSGHRSASMLATSSPAVDRTNAAEGGFQRSSSVPLGLVMGDDEEGGRWRARTQEELQVFRALRGARREGSGSGPLQGNRTPKKGGEG
ncbi:hypothetical protein HK101_007988, partial [Irineochytrium annulatum]